jgi:opacity protein-like surface antigen
MTRPFGTAAPAALLLLAAAGTAGAQASATTPERPLSFGVSGGLSLPTGDAGDVFSSGFNVDALLEVRARPASPLAFRFEAGYQRFAIKDEVREVFEEFGADIDVNARVVSGLVNAVYKFPGVAVRPYVLGGVGVFNVGGSASVSGVDESGEILDEDESGSTTRFGFNVGGGLEVPLSGVTAFGEIRFQSIRTPEEPFNIVPIKVGIRF